MSLMIMMLLTGNGFLTTAFTFPIASDRITKVT